MDEVKVFHPDGASQDPAVPGAGRPAVATTRVAEVTAERDMDIELPLPLHLLPVRGAVAVQLRSLLRRVAMGAGLARRSELVAAVRAIPGLPGLTSSPAGGTFVIGGDAWLGVAAIGTPPPGDALAIDWMLGALRDWLGLRLAPLGVGVATGRIDGAWCPGFSDISIDGRKLVGLGFRVTRDWVVMRGVLAVRTMPPADLALLQAVHRLIDVEVRAEACTSLADITGDPTWTVDRAVELLAGPDGPAVVEQPPPGR